MSEKLSGTPSFKEFTLSWIHSQEIASKPRKRLLSYVDQHFRRLEMSTDTVEESTWKSNAL